jgi:hypothetical protein
MWREGDYDADAFSERKQWESKVKRSSRIINDAKKGSIRSIMAADVAGRVTMSRQGAPDPLRGEGTREKAKEVRAEVEPVTRRATNLEPAPVIRPLSLIPCPLPLPTDPDPYRPTLAELEAEYEAEEAWR